MRDILFRGKRVDNGEWVYGYYVRYDDEHYIFPQEEVNKGIDLGGSLDCCQMHEVDPETVGQYIGKRDVNGTKIFEGDILEREYYKGRTERIVICFEDTSFAYYYDDFRNCSDPIDDNEYGISLSYWNVAGNIHDKKE